MKILSSFMWTLGLFALANAQDCATITQDASVVIAAKATQDGASGIVLETVYTGTATFTTGSHTEDEVKVNFKVVGASNLETSSAGGKARLFAPAKQPEEEMSAAFGSAKPSLTALLAGACFLTENRLPCLVAAGSALTLVTGECTVTVEVEFVFPASGDFSLDSVGTVFLPSHIPCPTGMEKYCGVAITTTPAPTDPPAGSTTKAPADTTKAPGADTTTESPDRPEETTADPATVTTNPPGTLPPTEGPAPQRPTKFSTDHFLALGDWGKTPNDDASIKSGSFCSSRVVRCRHAQQNCGIGMAKWIGSHPSKFILSHGDLFYWNGISIDTDPRIEEHFEKLYAQVEFKGVPWYNVLGNHDIGGASGICHGRPNEWVGIHNGHWCNSDAEMEAALNAKANSLKNYANSAKAKQVSENGKYNGRFRFDGVYYKTLDTFAGVDGGPDITVEVYHIDTNAAATRKPETCCQCFSGSKDALRFAPKDGMAHDYPALYNGFWDFCTNNEGNPNLSAEQKSIWCQPDSPDALNTYIADLKRAKPQVGAIANDDLWKTESCVESATEKCRPRAKCEAVLDKWWEDGLAALRNDLAASTADWKIVHNHYMINSAIGNKHLSHDQNTALNTIMKDGGVNIFIGGHTHSEGHDYDPNTGIHYLLNGGGGGKSIEGGFGNIWSAQTFAFMAFEVNKDWLRVRVIDDIGTNLYCYDIPKNSQHMAHSGTASQEHGYQNFKCDLSPKLNAAFLPTE